MALLSTLLNVIRGNRNNALPSVEQVSSHVNVTAPHGPIFIVKGWEQKEWMRDWLSYVAPQSCPSGIEDASKQGYILPENDVVVAWMRAGDQLTDNELVGLREVRDRILGPRELITPGKPHIDESGAFVGGVAFERDDAANNKGMSAPHRGRKTYGQPLDPHAELVRDVLEAGASVGMDGLGRGPAKMEDLLKDRAEYLNVPLVGTSENIAFPSFQLNIASAVDSDSSGPHSTPSRKPVANRYGSAHADCGDSASATTAMTCLTEPHPDAIEDVFFIQDFGIAIIIEE
ncbi:hypothetical protein NMY22_g5745 [Coprinellus aureogranulatus]|nr:hypothetical protein NMY22_g5745 [Coprinellus aureogranulatus]